MEKQHLKHTEGKIVIRKTAHTFQVVNYNLGDKLCKNELAVELKTRAGVIPWTLFIAKKFYMSLRTLVCCVHTV